MILIITPFAPHLTGKIIDYEIVDRFDDIRKNCDTTGVTNESFLSCQIHIKRIADLAYYLLIYVQELIVYLKSRFTHIIIDEYQDCSEIQHRLFMSLVQNGLIGVAVGDPEQVIFEFAGKSCKLFVN